MWQYVGKDYVAFPQAILSPGVVTEATFGAYPLQQDEWVDHLEWDLFGRTYSSPSFAPGEFVNNMNFKPCP